SPPLQPSSQAAEASRWLHRAPAVSRSTPWSVDPDPCSLRWPSRSATPMPRLTQAASMMTYLVVVTEAGGAAGGGGMKGPGPADVNNCHAFCLLMLSLPPGDDGAAPP